MRIFSVICVVIATAFFVSCSGEKSSADFSFAKRAFESLARGDAAVSEDIDWETLNSLGNPVGAQYIALETIEDRENFKKGFITQFSAAFRDSGGSIDDFTNWRVTRNTENITEVTADSAKGALVVTVSERDAKRRLSALKIIKTSL